MEVDVQSVETLGNASDDSDIEVIACYRHVPIQPQDLMAGRAMTVDTSQCVIDDHPNFPWDEFDSIMQQVDDQSNLLDIGAGPSTSIRSNSPPINHCAELTPFVDTPLSPPPCDRGPTNGTFGNITPEQPHQQLNLMRIYKGLV